MAILNFYDICQQYDGDLSAQDEEDKRKDDLSPIANRNHLTEDIDQPSKLTQGFLQDLKDESPKKNAKLTEDADISIKLEVDNPDDDPEDIEQHNKKAY